MAIPNATKQAASDAAAARGAWLTLFTGAGAGTTGANEGAGVTRKQTVWTPDGTGKNVGSTQSIPAPAGTYTEGGIMSAATGGSFVGSGPFAGGSIVVNGTGVSIDLSVTWS